MKGGDRIQHEIKRILRLVQASNCLTHGVKKKNKKSDTEYKQKNIMYIVETAQIEKQHAGKIISKY
jgi:hypothetical protein